MKIVCISDMHERYGGLDLPEGDILVCTGDFSDHAHSKDVERFNKWGNYIRAEYSFRHRLLVTGNHDRFCLTNPVEAATLLTNWTWLQANTIEIEAKIFHGISWQPWAWDDMWAKTGKRFIPLYAQIPEKIDVLLTHGPPFGIRDQVLNGAFVGDKYLANRVLEVRPQAHIFGHIHEAYGRTYQDGIEFINASICNIHGELTNAPIILEID